MHALRRCLRLDICFIPSRFILMIIFDLTVVFWDHVDIIDILFASLVNSIKVLVMYGESFLYLLRFSVSFTFSFYN